MDHMVKCGFVGSGFPDLARLATTSLVVCSGRRFGFLCGGRPRFGLARSWFMLPTINSPLLVRWLHELPTLEIEREAH